MMIYVAMIMHNDGATGFAATTEEGRMKKVANWCREHWPSRGKLPDELESTLDQDIVDWYFELPDGRVFLLWLDEDEVEGAFGRRPRKPRPIPGRGA